MKPIEEMTSAEVERAIIQMEGDVVSLSPVEVAYLQALKDVNLHGFTVGLGIARTRALDRQAASRKLATPEQIAVAKKAAIAVDPDVIRICAERDDALNRIRFYRKENIALSERIAIYEKDESELSSLKLRNHELELAISNSASDIFELRTQLASFKSFHGKTKSFIAWCITRVKRVYGYAEEKAIRLRIGIK